MNFNRSDATGSNFLRRWRLAIVALVVLPMVAMMTSSTNVGAQETDVAAAVGAATAFIGGSMEVPVVLESQSTDAGGMAITITYDSTVAEFVSCAGAIDLVVCNGDTDGEVRMAAVTGTTWPDGTALLTMTFNGLTPDYDGIFAASAEEWIDAANGDAITASFDGSAAVVTLKGDVNCSEKSDIVDALMIAQFEVGNRSDTATCPFGVQATELNAQAGDMNGDGTVNIVDALLISQCSVGVVLPQCDGTTVN